MKPPRKHLAILHQPEIQDLFGPPRLTIEEKRFYFTLNDLELKSVFKPQPDGKVL
jgi:hypothetical protein